MRSNLFHLGTCVHRHWTGLGLKTTLHSSLKVADGQLRMLGLARQGHEIATVLRANMIDAIPTDPFGYEHILLRAQATKADAQARTLGYA